jgi:prepilin-type processing-associated H-X9-DG protein
LPPASAIVFVDERADSINDGWFSISTGYYGDGSYQSTWSAAAADIDDLPAIYHNNSSSFSFADGHGEIHQWRDPRTLALSYNAHGQVVANDVDCVWLTTHGTVPTVIFPVGTGPNR